MNTYPIRDSAGKILAFEIENVYITLSRACSVLEGVEGVSDVRRRKPFRSPADVHIRFRYLGIPFILWEPYADSSRYWIGPEDEKASPRELGELQGAFDRYQPPIGLRVIGDLLSLRPLKRVRPT